MDPNVKRLYSLSWWSPMSVRSCFELLRLLETSIIMMVPHVQACLSPNSWSENQDSNEVLAILERLYRWVADHNKWASEAQRIDTLWMREGQAADLRTRPKKVSRHMVVFLIRLSKARYKSVCGVLLATIRDRAGVCCWSESNSN